MLEGKGGGAEGEDASTGKAWPYVRVSGLAFLPGLVCPHHDRVQSNGVLRATDFDGMLARHPGETGLCIDHFAALVIEGDSYAEMVVMFYVTGRPGAFWAVTAAVTAVGTVVGISMGTAVGTAAVTAVGTVAGIAVGMAQVRPWARYGLSALDTTVPACTACCGLVGSSRCLLRVVTACRRYTVLQLEGQAGSQMADGSFAVGKGTPGVRLKTVGAEGSIASPPC